MHNMWGNARTHVARETSRMWLVEHLILEGVGRSMGPKTQTGRKVEEHSNG